MQKNTYYLYTKYPNNFFDEERMNKQTISLKPIEKESLYLKISDSIYSYIKMNDLQPGDKLPSERDMSAMLQTSRNSVREALRILEDRGLIYVKTGSGVFVNNPYGQNNTLSIRLTDCTIEELQDLQKVLDHQAVLNAIKNGNSEEKEKLFSVASKMHEMYLKNIYSHTLDHSFHSLLYKMGRNNAIHQLITKIRDARFVYRNETDSENDSIWLSTIPDHLALSTAILQQDLSAAINAIDAINDYGFSLKK